MRMRQDMVLSSIVGKRDSICADSEVPVQDWQGTYIKVEPGRVYRGVPVPEHQGQSLPAQRYEWQPQQPPLRNPFAGGAKPSQSRSILLRGSQQITMKR